MANAAFTSTGLSGKTGAHAEGDWRVRAINAVSYSGNIKAVKANVGPAAERRSIVKGNALLQCLDADRHVGCLCLCFAEVGGGQGGGGVGRGCAAGYLSVVSAAERGLGN